MGVASLKLEGRMKRPEYVAAVTNVYRRALDGQPVTTEMMDTLWTAFNRQGFSDGYYTSQTGKNMFGIREEKGEDNAFLRRMRQTYEATENQLVEVKLHAVVAHEGSSLTVVDPEGRSCTVQGPVPALARTQLITEQDLAERLSKTGGTPYKVGVVTADITPGLNLSASAINAMRRDALNQMTAIRGRRDSVMTLRLRKLPVFAGNKERPDFTVQVTTREQITQGLLMLNPAVLYVPLHILEEDPSFTKHLARRFHVAAVLPRIVHDREMDALRNSLQEMRKLGIREVLVGNLGLMMPAREAGMAIRGDFGLNIYNSLAMYTVKELELISATLSFEMTMPQIRDVSKAVPSELLVYGRMPLMVTENCLFKGKTGKCACQLGPMKLVDKTGAEFPVIRDGKNCRSVLLNGKKLSWLDRQNDLAKLGLWAVRLYFTTENAKEVDRVAASCISPVPFDHGACTRGLYLRGLE